jgi:hypothetical protein
MDEKINNLTKTDQFEHLWDFKCFDSFKQFFDLNQKAAFYCRLRKKNFILFFNFQD